MMVPKKVKEVIALIPARSGSKGLKKKNIITLAGKPLMSYSILPALACPVITRVIVSTDSEEFAVIAEELGAEVPFLRPPRLATDQAALDDVILFTLNRLFEEEGYEADALMLILPSFPFKTENDFFRMVQKMNHLDSDSVLPVVLRDLDPYRYFLIAGDTMKIPSLQDFGFEPCQPYYQGGCNFSLKRLVHWRFVHHRYGDACEYNRVYHTIMQEAIRKKVFSGGQVNLEYSETIFHEIHSRFDLLVAEEIYSRNLFNG